MSHASAPKLRKLSVRTGVAFIIALSASAARAADATGTYGPPPSPASATPDPHRFGGIVQRLGAWEVIIGGGAVIEPEYEGSGDFTAQPVPFVSATFADRVEVTPLGAEISLYEWNIFEASALLGYDSGRDEDDSDRLTGLGDIDAGAVVGGKLQANLGPAALFLEGEQTLGGSEGFVAEAGVEVEHAISQYLILGAHASVTFADDKHMDAYFGVNDTQAVRSGYAAFDPGAGIKRLDVGASAIVAFSEHWFMRGEAGVGFLVGDAADSPIVEEEIQPNGSLFLGYRF